ncbi:MAG: antibiotic biosynthesis monooxygenase [Candidatus Kapabacteria bacterium]|jgi:heme-degrading monooxygenase HmoA|nr:antibiotic biosynthesis monooxygenase [Candidatus Kapabacteria bacterium]
MRDILIFSTLLFFSCGAALAQNRQQATEIAVYHIRPEKQGQFLNNLREFRKNIASLEGFQTYQTLASVAETGVYVDIVLWRNASNAEKAAQRVKTDRTFAPFIQSIDSVYAYGDFLPLYSPKKPKKIMNNKQNITEVVMYQIKQSNLADYAKICNDVTKELENFQGFISRTVLQDHKDPSIFVDVVVWASLEVAQNAPKKAETLPAMQPFFAATERVISFQHYATFTP